MPEDLLRSLIVQPPVRGLHEGLDPASLSPEFAPELENLRCNLGRWQPRPGMSNWKTAGSTGNVHYLARWYLNAGTVYTLVGRNGACYQQTGSGAFSAVTNGTGLTTSPAYGKYQGGTWNDLHYLATRSGNLKRIDASTGMEDVTQPTAPAVAPTVRRRVFRVLEDWGGAGASVGSAPPGWTISDATNFPLVVAELAGGTANDAVPDFPYIGNVVKFTVKTSGCKNETATENVAGGEPLNSRYLCFYQQAEIKRSFITFEIGAKAAAEFGFALDPPESDQPVLKVCELGFLAEERFKRFRCLRAAGTNKHIYVGPLLLTGNLQGIYRYGVTFRNSTTKRESSLSDQSGDVDCSAIPTDNKFQDTSAVEKAAEITLAGMTLPASTSADQFRVYRNGSSIAELAANSQGDPLWLLVHTGGIIDSTLAASVSAKAGSITVPTGQGAANLASGHFVVLDEGVSSKQEVVGVDSVTTGSPNDTIYLATGYYAFTDLVIDNSNAAKITSASRTFTSADVGKRVKITGGTGFTAGNYTISSVAAGAATLNTSVGTTSSTGGAGKLYEGLGIAHSSGATVRPAYLDNTNDATLNLLGQLYPERDDPPAGAHWLVRAPDGRMVIARWSGRNLGLAISNQPTVERPFDHEVFPDVSPVGRSSQVQGFRVDIDADGAGDSIQWAGYYRGVLTIITTRSLYTVWHTSQAQWGPSAVVKRIDNTGTIAPHSVCEVGGQLCWLAEGPKVVAWDGSGGLRDLSSPRLTNTLGNAPSAYWSQAFAVGHSDTGGTWYRLCFTPSGATTNTAWLDYDLTRDAWEPRVHYAATGTARSDLAIDASDNTKVTSSGTPFTSADVNKVLKITAGTNFITGYYPVVAVVSGAATLGAAVGTVGATSGSGTMLAGIPWATAMVRNGPGDAQELYAAHLSTGVVYQLETGLTDDSVPIPVRCATAKVPFEGDWLCRAEKAYLRLTPSGTDTLALRVRCGGSEYRNVTDFPACDGDPFQDWAETLSDTDSAETELFQRLNFYRLRGRHVQFRLLGAVSNAPALRWVRLDYSHVRRNRLAT